MNKKRVRPPDKRSIRNLKQYQDKTDEEFEEIYNRMIVDASRSEELEQRIESKLKEFEEDYDLSDLNYNDKQQVRALCQTWITLEDFEQLLFKMRMEGINMENLTIIDKLNKFISDLRADVSKIQDDLGISRKARKGDKEESVINYIEYLKQEAKDFYQARMCYILCDKCGMVLSTAWFQYPDNNNKLVLRCGREGCGNKVEVDSKTLYEQRGTNTPDLLPQSMK